LPAAAPAAPAGRGTSGRRAVSVRRRGVQIPKVGLLAIRNPLKNRVNVTGGTAGWKAALNALTMYYGDRITLN
jgi:hypothetical protein